jgi:predicted ATP-dependent endonuclease of OLD family
LLWWIFELHFGDTNNYRIVCIDEIERSLHPQIQTVILEMIKERSRHQQYFITTHSTYIANPHIAQKIHRVSKKGQVMTADRADFNKPSIFTVDHNRLFFADDVLFVEGIDDLAYFSEKLIEYGHEELVYRLFFANSKNNIDFFESICKRLGINFHAIVDDDYTDKVRKLNSGNRRMMERVIDHLHELTMIDKTKIDLESFDTDLAGSPKIEANKKATLVKGKSYRKVQDRNIYPLMHGKLENYKSGKNRNGEDAEAKQQQELRDIFDNVEGK